MTNSKTSTGFTLIELLISVSIIGILASVAIPSYERYSNRARFAEAPLAISIYRTAIVVAAEANRFEELDDIDEGEQGIPDKISRSSTQHGIHVHDGEIKFTWRDDNSPLDGVNFTLTAQNFEPPIRWVQGGTCVYKGYC